MVYIPQLRGSQLQLQCQSQAKIIADSLLLNQEQPKKILLGRSGGGPGKSLNSNSGSNPDNYSLNSSRKTAPKIINYSLGSFSFKNERQSNLAKIKQQLNESI